MTTPHLSRSNTTPSESAHRQRRTRGLAAWALAVLAAAFGGRTTSAQVIQRHQASPCCWQPTGCNWSIAQTWVDTSTHRVLDVSTWDANSGQITFVFVCGGMAQAPYARPHAIDSAVDRATAINNANLNGMFISAVAPFRLGGVQFFVSLREQLPTGCSWQWIPSTTQAGVSAWLQSNPSYQPYSIDTSVNNGVLEYHVMAMQGPGVRTASLVFGATAASLPSPSVPGGSSIISFAMDSSTTFAAVVQASAPSIRTDYIAVLPTASNYVTNSIHAQMERIFSFAHWHGPTGTTEYALVVNNAWSLYDIGGYPQSIPSPGFRGCANSLATTTMVVTSSVPGVAAPGSTLTFTVAPKPSISLGLLQLGLSRMNPVDLTPVGAPGCWVIPSPDVLSLATNPGSIFQWAMPLPGGTALLGARFYAQGGVADPAANALGISTSNAYMITIQ